LLLVCRNTYNSVPNIFVDTDELRCVTDLWNRAIAEAVSRWLPTAAARVRARVGQVGFVVNTVASGQVFFEYFGFPCQNRSFDQILHHHHNHPGQLAEASQRTDRPSKESCRLS
jgi:hypothetical protein